MFLAVSSKLTIRSYHLLTCQIINRETYGEHDKVENGVGNIREESVGDHFDSMTSINADLIFNGSNRHVSTTASQYGDHRQCF